MRAAVLAIFALAVTAIAVSAESEPLKAVRSLRAHSWNLEIAVRRTAERSQISQGGLKAKTPLAKQFCVAPVQVEFAHILQAAGSPSKLLFLSPLPISRNFNTGRAPPVV